MLCVSLLLIGCNNPSEKQLELELAQSTLEKNIAMYETVWDKVINDRQIDLINEEMSEEIPPMPPPISSENTDISTSEHEDDLPF